jgi:NADPH:quinone reductase-like Zn-dependent oxidoreductase
MQAVVTSNFGGPSVLEWRQVPIPEPGPRDVVVKVRVAALNPVDWV